MPSPFPGMDPYLENPELWPEVHSRLIVAIADNLAPSLHPHYYAAIEKRIYLDTPEDSILVLRDQISTVSMIGLDTAFALIINNNSNRL